MKQRFRVTFRSASDRLPIDRSESDRKVRINVPINFRSFPIKESLGLIRTDQNSRARAEVVLFTNKQPVTTSNLFYSIWAEAFLSKPVAFVTKRLGWKVLVFARKVNA